MSPLTADSYYGTAVLSTDGLGAITGTATPTPPEIVELKRALKGDPDLIYQYVRNNIQTVWMYGLQKGALGASIDKSGTPFDQAELMVALLRQAGITAKYVAGTIYFGSGGASIQQFTDWTGISDARAACQLLANGGIPGAVNGVSDAACSTIAANTALTSVRMAHIWVRATISGSHTAGCAAFDQCDFDPSYKAYTWKTGIPLGTAMGLVAGTPLSHATSGSNYHSGTTGPNNDVPYARALNSGVLNSDMQTYSNNLLGYIQSHNLQGAQMEDIIGGGVLVSSTTALRQGALPYADPSPPYALHFWTPGTDAARYNAVPDQYRTTLKVEGKTKHDGSDDDVDMFIVPSTSLPPLLYADEIYGRRLTVETDFTQSGIGSTQPNYYHQKACLALDAAAWSTWDNLAQCLVRYSYDPPGAPPNKSMARTFPTHMILTANHPYAAAAAGGSAGSYMDATIDKPVGLVTPLTIVHGWGDVSPALLAKWSEERASDASLPILETGTQCYPSSGEQTLCFPAYDQPTGGFGREKTAASWLAQVSRAARLNAQIANAAPQVHHMLGFVYGDVNLRAVITRFNDQAPGFVVSDNFDRLDVDAGISFSSRTSTDASAGARRGALRSFAAAASMLEGSMSGQQADVPDTSSTATRFEWGNAPDSGLQNPFGLGAQDFYAFNSGNKAEAYVKGTRNGLLQVDGGDMAACDGSLNIPWTSQPTLTFTECYGDPGAGNPAVGIAGNVAGEIGSYADSGFTVYASKETFLGPGQRGGAPLIALNSTGQPSTYSTDGGNQRGGAFVALKGDNDEPVEIAHVIMGGGTTTKGGGGGTQPDNKTTYDPATAADILKSRFVDRSNALGVNLANGTLGLTSPVSIDVGTGGFPYQLSAGFSWHPGMPTPFQFGPISPVAPEPGWIHGWKNSLALSGSGLEAMGSSDIRAAVGAIVSFATAQDIYQAQPSVSREVAGVLTQSWWAHQLSANVATVNMGGNARQFVRLPDSSWIAPGTGYAKLEQAGTRSPYEEKCFHQYRNPPYAMSRGWNGSGLSFKLTNAQGDVQNFEYFENLYHSFTEAQPNDLCGKLKGYRLKDWTFPFGMTVTPTYTAGNPQSDTFDTLSAVTNGNGVLRDLNFTNTTIGGGTRSITLGDASPLPPSMTDANSKTTSFVYEPVKTVSATQRPALYHMLQSMTTPEKATLDVKYVYDKVNHVQEAYDASALLTTPTRGPYVFLIADGTRGERDDPLGQAYTVVYDIYGHPSRYVDEMGRETQTLLDGRGRMVSTVYPEGDCEAFDYDDRNNTTGLWKVDKVSNCVKLSGPTHVLHATVAWDSTWNKPTSVVNFRGKTTTLDYYDTTDPPLGRGLSLLKSATRPAIDQSGTPVTPVYLFTYDPKGKVMDATNPSGIVTHSDYQANEDPKQTVVDPGTGSHLNLITSYTYDTNANLQFTTDPRGFVTESLYDPDRRKTEDHHHDGDGFANLNGASRTVYDFIGRVVDDQVGTDFTGGTITWLTVKHTTYTPTSKVATVTDADNRTMTMLYDDGDRQIQTTDPIGRKTRFAYCQPGNPDCAANQVKTEWHAWQSGGACSSGTSLQMCYRRVTYWPDGLQKTLKDANGNLTSYSYDGFNRPYQIVFPDGTSETVPLTGGYDENGNVLSRINRAGTTLSFTYNDLDWMVTKAMPKQPSGTLNTAWTYMLDGRIDVLSDDAGTGNTIDYGYDTAGRMTSVATKIPGIANKTTSYQLDKNGNRIKLTWPGAYVVNYCYDSLNRMTGAAESSVDCSSAVLASYAYDNQSRRKSVTYPGGAKMTYGYSDAGDVTSLQHDLNATAAYNTFTYHYTPAHQTDIFDATNTAWLWRPSANGSTGYTVNNLNQYPTVGSQATGGTNCQGTAQGLSYDCNGNLTFDGATTFTYDAENRLLTASKTGLAATYSYDPLGRRTKKTGTGVTETYYLSDGTDEIAEYAAGSVLLARTVPGPAIDEPIARIDGSGVKTFYHTDKQGSVVAMSDTSGNLVEGPYIYDSYGNCFSGGTACGTSGQPYRYTGRRFDPELGCYYYRARYYCSDDKRGGRFLQTDPVGYTADLNLYAYVGNDPVNGTDPTGNCDINNASRIGAASDSICSGTKSTDPDHPNAGAGSPFNNSTHPREYQAVVYYYAQTDGAASRAGTSGDADDGCMPEAECSGQSHSTDTDADSTDGSTSCEGCFNVASNSITLLPMPHANDNIPRVQQCIAAGHDCLQVYGNKYRKACYEGEVMCNDAYQRWKPGKIQMDVSIPGKTAVMIMSNGKVIIVPAGQKYTAPPKK